MSNPDEPVLRASGLQVVEGLSTFEFRSPVVFTDSAHKAAFLTHLGAVAATALDTDGTLAANSDTRIASQKAVKTYVTAQIAAVVGAAPGALDTLYEIATSLGNNASLSATLIASIATKAPLANPAFTGAITGAVSLTLAGNNNGPSLYSGIIVGFRDSASLTASIYGAENKLRFFIDGADRLLVAKTGQVEIPGSLTIAGHAAFTTDDLASIEEAEAGTVDDKLMTPETTAAAIAALGGSGGGGAISLGALTAFLRPGGNDSTGTVGDPAKPYATAAAALTDGARVLILAARTSGDYGPISLSADVSLVGYGKARSVLGAVTLNGHKLTGNGEQLVSVGAVSGGGTIEDLTAASIAAHGEEALAPGTPGTSGASVAVIRSRVTGNAELYGGNGGSDSYISGSPTQFTVECAPGNHTATLTLDGVPFSIEVIDGSAVFPDISGWARSSFGSSSPLISENYTSVTYADYSVGASGGLNIVAYTPGSPDIPTAGGDGGSGGTLTLTRSTVEGAILLGRGLAGSGGIDGEDGTLHAVLSIHPSPTGSFTSGQISANIVDGVFFP